MSAVSDIQWTDRTWNPVRGCSVVSPGCVNCYAMKMAHRFSGPGKPYEGLTKQTSAGPQWTGAVRTIDAALLEPLSWRKPQKVFVNSMSDLFHEAVPGTFIDHVFAVMALSPHHTFQILTKRPERMRSYLSDEGSRYEIELAMYEIGGDHDARTISDSQWPLPNVWLGVSVEDQQRYDQRIGHLLRTPAAVRFLSAEPLLGPIDLRMGGMSLPDYSAHDPLPQVDWVIVGGESGPGARPMDLAWARSIQQQCQAARVPVFVKQLGAIPLQRCSNCGNQVGRVMSGFTDACGPTHAALIAEGIRISDHKGGDITEWPADLQVREWPRAVVEA